MRPDQALSIYEIRAVDQKARSAFENENNIDRLGPNLAGLHWEADFAFLFFMDQAGEELDIFLKEQPGLELRHIHELTYAQWQDGAGARPLKVENLSIVGPDQEAPEPKVTIDPGLAFGFGGHQTTLSCLEFLSRAARYKPAPPSTALDLGTGTGILALAAARLGLERILGVDYSHLAIKAADRNLAINNLEEQVEFRRGPAQDYAGHPAELLMANLHLSLQEELFELGAFHDRRLVIVSGLLPSEGDRLWAKLSSIGLKLIDQVRTDRWISLFCGRD